ncbi:ATP-binding cassette domain-containing protein [Priestia abyssalis]|uniref:ATP-binding cassette domain-containing protein n=1 Tax=Priestia abyssalis TaxID=1221450 RepID=UPI000994A6A0|nr:dipeptide/oligopeptide/nickel ABC transporter ATP-binding protein [Priestia abyssalis]
MEKSPLMEVRNLQKVYGGRQGLLLPNKKVTAVHDVSFSIQKGETFGLIGESGSGKTTVGRMILRLIEPTNGSIIYNGTSLRELSAKQMAVLRRKIQIVFQDSGSAFNPRMTLGEQIAYPLLKFGEYEDKDDVNRKVYDMLEVVGLRKDFALRYPHELSGGQRQRAGIARSLILKPEFLVLDEPVSALDVSVKAQIINLLQELQKELQLTYLFIAHNLDLVAYFCDRVAVMSKGQIAETGTTVSLFRNPQTDVTKKLLGSILTLDGDLGNVQKKFYSA